MLANELSNLIFSGRFNGFVITLAAMAFLWKSHEVGTRKIAPVNGVERSLKTGKTAGTRDGHGLTRRSVGMTERGANSSAVSEDRLWI